MIPGQQGKYISFLEFKIVTTKTVLKKFKKMCHQLVLAINILKRNHMRVFIYFVFNQQTQPESPNYEIPGLADFVLIARSVIGTGCTIVLSHTLPMTKEFTAPRARDGGQGPPSQRGGDAESGVRGTDGIMGTNSK